MKILKNKIIVVMAILAVGLAPIICCSLMNNAYADSVLPQALEKTSPMPCHNTSQSQSTASKNNCNCQKMSALIQSQGSDILKSLTSLSFLSKYLSTLNLSLPQLVKDSSQFAAFSPPHFKSSVPLYLQNSVLRL